MYELPEGNIAKVQDNKQIPPGPAGYHEEAARKSATAKYLHRVRQVLKSQLNRKNKIRAINTYALPVIRHTAGITNCPKEEIEATDIMTRKLTPETRLCQGGRGLVSVKTIVPGKIQEYIRKMAPKDEGLNEYLRQQKPKGEDKEEEEPSRRDKPLHSMYHRQIEEVADIKKSYQQGVRCRQEVRTWDAITR